MKKKFLNSKGQEIKLTEQEDRTAKFCEAQIQNALGYEIQITTLTTLMKQIVEQKFFEVAPADFLPIRTGEGAWSSTLTTYRSFMPADDFTTGIVNTGANQARLANVDAGVDAVTISVKNWAKGLDWNIMDLNTAQKSGNWDLVSTRERARKKNWDLGIQKIAFLGIPGDSSTLGLLNQTSVTNNTTRITKSLKSMTGPELSTFCQFVLDDYRQNAVRTAWPTHFIIPESDYLGLAAPSDPNYQLRSKLALLEETFKIMTKNQNFQILPLTYCDTAYGGPATTSRYVLLNYSEDTLRMDIPVDYTPTTSNSVNGFSFQNVAYGQFTGVNVLRPAELLYYSY